MTEESQFQTLIRRIRAGDDTAAAELVRIYEPSIRRAARVRLVDSRLRRLFDSMDICQSVLASFFARAALDQYELERPEQLLRLLVDMTRKKVVDHAREHTAARRDHRRTPSTGLDVGMVAAPGESPSQEVSARELLSEFRNRLSEDERRLADRRASGIEWTQIAVEQGGSPEALRKRLTRAVDRVSQELGLGDPGHD